MHNLPLLALPLLALPLLALPLLALPLLALPLLSVPLSRRSFSADTVRHAMMFTSSDFQQQQLHWV
jgi:hypothetical protein